MLLLPLPPLPLLLLLLFVVFVALDVAASHVTTASLPLTVTTTAALNWNCREDLYGPCTRMTRTDRELYLSSMDMHQINCGNNSNNSSNNNSKSSNNNSNSNKNNSINNSNSSNSTAAATTATTAASNQQQRSNLKICLVEQNTQENGLKA